MDICAEAVLVASSSFEQAQRTIIFCYFGLV